MGDSSTSEDEGPIELTFTNKFCKALIKEDQENLILSPLSVEVVLAMAHQGTGGETAKILANALDVANQKAGADNYKIVMEALNAITDVTLNVANKIFVMKNFPLKNLFRTVIQESFMSETDLVDFGDNIKAANDINQWVEIHTNNKIKDIVSSDSLDKSVRLVLVNAVYFKGDWAHPFKEEDTSTERFYISANETVDCEMMFTYGRFNHWYYKKIGAVCIELPYKGKDVSMIIMLPYGGYNAFAKLESDLTNIDLSRLKIDQDIHYRSVEVSLPKFRIETTTKLKPVLEKMGLGVIFDRSRADFSEVSQTADDFFVSEFVQKAFVEVNEKGTEAAAATGGYMMTMSGPTRFTANHPFMFVIQAYKRNGYSRVLFVGKVIKPTY